jgi:hypothetical protein
MLGICEEESEEESDNFNGVLATVDVVAQEEEAGPWGRPGMYEYPEKIKDIPVDVPDDVEGGVKVHDDVGALEERLRTFADLGDNLFGKSWDRASAADLFASGAVELKKWTEALENQRRSFTRTRHLVVKKYGIVQQLRGDSNDVAIGPS